MFSWSSLSILQPSFKKVNSVLIILRKVVPRDKILELKLGGKELTTKAAKEHEGKYEGPAERVDSPRCGEVEGFEMCRLPLGKRPIRGRTSKDRQKAGTETILPGRQDCWGRAGESGGEGYLGQGISAGPAKPCFSWTKTRPWEGPVQPGWSMKLTDKSLVASGSKITCPSWQRQSSTI